MTFEESTLYEMLDGIEATLKTRLSFQEVEDERANFKKNSCFELTSWVGVSMLYSAIEGKEFRCFLLFYIKVCFLSRNAAALITDDLPASICRDLTDFWGKQEYLSKWDALTLEDIALVRRWLYELYIPQSNPDYCDSPKMLASLAKLELQLLSKISDWGSVTDWAVYEPLLRTSDEAVFCKLCCEYIQCALQVASITEYASNVFGDSFTQTVLSNLTTHPEKFNNFTASQISQLKQWVALSAVQTTINQSAHLRSQIDENLLLLELSTQ
jgi:hypothetical protein